MCSKPSIGWNITRRKPPLHVVTVCSCDDLSSPGMPTGTTLSTSYCQGADCSCHQKRTSAEPLNYTVTSSSIVQKCAESCWPRNVTIPSSETNVTYGTVIHTVLTSSQLIPLGLLGVVLEPVESIRTTAVQFKHRWVLIIQWGRPEWSIPTCSYKI